MRDQGGKSARRDTSRKRKSPPIRWRSGRVGFPQRPATRDLPMALLETDLHGVITAWDVGAERMFGHTARQAVGQPLNVLISPERRPEQDELTARAACGETIEGIETLGLR